MDEGTGMGLSVVLGVIRSLGGNIRVESEVGKGTTFRLLFPRCRRGCVRSAPHNDLLELHGSEQVFFVDDEQMMVDLARDMLIPLGYAVTNNIQQRGRAEAAEGRERLGGYLDHRSDNARHDGD